jgi:hypothetical protein
VHQQWGWQMMEQAGSSRVEHEMPRGFASRAPVLANTTSPLAERIATRDPSRPPVQATKVATKVATPRNAISRNQSLPEHAVYHAEHAAQAPQGSHPVQDQQMVPAADKDVIDALLMLTHSAENQASVAGTLYGLCHALPLTTGQYTGFDAVEQSCVQSQRDRAGTRSAPSADDHLLVGTTLPTPEGAHDVEDPSQIPAPTSAVCDTSQRFQMLLRCIQEPPFGPCVASCTQITHSTRKRKTSQRNRDGNICVICKTHDTSKWRAKGTLCNACCLHVQYDPEKQKRRRKPEHQERAKRKAKARKRRYAAAAVVLVTSDAVKKEAQKKQSPVGRLGPRQCVVCEVAKTTHWRCRGLLCNSCALGASRLLRKCKV